MTKAAATGAADANAAAMAVEKAAADAAKAEAKAAEKAAAAEAKAAKDAAAAAKRADAKLTPAQRAEKAAAAEAAAQAEAQAAAEAALTPAQKKAKASAAAKLEKAEAAKAKAAADKEMKAAADAAKAPAAAPPPRGTARLWITLVLIAITMTVASQAPAALLPMALGCLCVLVRLGCMTLKEAWTAVNGPVLLSIALSFALGEAIKKSDLASIVAGSIVSVVAPYGNLALLFAIYFVAILIGAVISNNAVVALMFPIVVRICEQAGVSWKPALYALTLAASASFSTPVSYQTNLMVAADAGYSFGDFLKFGVPLQLVCMLATVPACMVLAK